MSTDLCTRCRTFYKCRKLLKQQQSLKENEKPTSQNTETITVTACEKLTFNGQVYINSYRLFVEIISAP